MPAGFYSPTRFGKTRLLPSRATQIIDREQYENVGIVSPNAIDTLRIFEKLMATKLHLELN